MHPYCNHQPLRGNGRIEALYLRQPHLIRQQIEVAMDQNKAGTSAAWYLSVRASYYVVGNLGYNLLVI